MKKKEIKQFSGLNDNTSVTDIGNVQAEEIKNYEIAKKFGKLVKRNGSSDNFSSYPSDWTIQSIHKMEVSKPSEKTFFLIHAQVGGVDKLYIYPYLDWTGSWINGWQELTEGEENFNPDDTGGNTTDATNIYYSGLLQSTADYYNNWVVCNFSQGKQGLVEDYIDGRLILKSPGIASQTSADTISIYRFPLHFNYTQVCEADTGTSGTTLIDAANAVYSDICETPARADDYYNDWTITIGEGTTTSSTTVSDFEAQPFWAWEKVIYTLTADLGSADGNSFFVFNPTRTLFIDDIKIVSKSNISTIITGTTYAHPKQYPFWFGYIKEYSFFLTDNKNLPGYYLYSAVLDSPDRNVLASLGTQAGGDLGESDYKWYVRLAFVYHGGQIGPLTPLDDAVDKGNTLGALSTSQDLNIGLNVGWINSISQKFSQMFDYRIKAIRLYMSNSGTGIAPDVPYGKFYFIDEIQIRGDSSQFYVWSGTDPYTQTIRITGTDWSNRGNDYEIDAGTSNSSSRLNTQANYNERLDFVTRSVIANINLDVKEPATLMYSTITAEGNYSFDVHPPLNSVSLSLYGATDIKAIRRILVFEEQLTRFIVFDKSMIIRIYLSTSATFDFEVESVLTGRGCNSWKSIADVERYLFYYSSAKMVCVYDGNQIIVISDLIHSSIQRALDAITTQSYHDDAIGWYYPRMRQYWLHIQSASSIYRTFIYQMFEGKSVYEGVWIEASFPDQLVGAIVDKNGNLYIADSTKIYLADDITATDDDGTAIVPSWKSKQLQVVNDKMADFSEILAFYKSNTALDIKFYLNRSATPVTLQNVVFGAKTTEGKENAKLPSGQRVGEYAQLEIALTTANQADNTEIEVDEIDLLYNEVEYVN